MNNVFGKRLRMLRREKDIVMTELAEAVGLTQATVSKYENGKRIPNIEIIQRLARYLNVSTDYLIGKSDVRNTYDDDQELPEAIKKLVAEEGFDISGMSNKEIAAKLVKVFRIEQIAEND